MPRLLRPPRIRWRGGSFRPCARRRRATSDTSANASRSGAPDGTINFYDIGGELGSRSAVEAGAARLRTTLAGGSPGGTGAELESLRKALQAERETSDFYKKMVATLDAEGKSLFERFVEIEEGHLAIVQAEMDLVTGSGFWFDTGEFRPEAG